VRDVTMLCPHKGDVTPNTIQKQLTEFYRSELDTFRRNRTFTDEQAMELSAPFLLSVHENYLNAAVKIMYVGKETNGWGGIFKNLHDCLSIEEEVDRILRRYDREIKEEPKWNNRFFVEYKKVRKALTADKTGSII